MKTTTYKEEMSICNHKEEIYKKEYNNIDIDIKILEEGSNHQEDFLEEMDCLI